MTQPSDHTNGLSCCQSTLLHGSIQKKQSQFFELERFVLFLFSVDIHMARFTDITVHTQNIYNNVHHLTPISGHVQLQKSASNMHNTHINSRIG